MSKRCTRCGQYKALAEFSAHPKAADGLQSQCKACCAERARFRRVGRPCTTCGSAMSPDTKRYARVCANCLSRCTQCGATPRLKNQRLCGACQAASDKTRKASTQAKLKERIARIKSKYKVRPALASMLAIFNRCEACGKKSSRPGDMHVDHCHATGAVRGVLCFNCNAALGHVRDSADRLRKLAAYLEGKKVFQDSADLEKIVHFAQLLIELEQRADKESGVGSR